MLSRSWDSSRSELWRDNIQRVLEQVTKELSEVGEIGLATFVHLRRGSVETSRDLMP